MSWWAQLKSWKTMDPMGTVRPQVGSLQSSQSHPFKSCFIFRLTIVNFCLFWVGIMSPAPYETFPSSKNKHWNVAAKTAKNNLHFCCWHSQPCNTHFTEYTTLHYYTTNTLIWLIFWGGAIINQTRTTKLFSQLVVEDEMPNAERMLCNVGNLKSSIATTA